MALSALGLALLLAASACFAAPAKAAKKAPAKKAALIVGQAVVVTLQNGSKVEGVYQGDADGAIWVEVDGGEVGVEKSTIVDMVAGKADTAEFKKRAATIGPKDAEAWWELALWAEQAGLHTSANTAAKNAIRINRDHDKARKFLGYEKVKGSWHQGDDIHRAKGLVQLDGDWVAPEELEAAKARAENDQKESNLRSMRLHKPAKYAAEEPAPAKPARPFGGWVDSGNSSR